MKEYRKIFQFYYNGKCYNKYLDKKNKAFYLRVDQEGRLYYLDIDEFADIVLQFNSIPNVMNAIRDGEKKKIKIIPKVIMGSTAVALSATILTTAISQKEIPSNIISGDTITDKVSYDDAKDDLESSEELEIDTYFANKWSDSIYIYDMNYLNQAFDEKQITMDDIRKQIKKNSKISSDFKELMYTYCDAVEEKYPDIELRVFYENLKTLKIVECTKSELISSCWSADSSGCYVKSKNKIYVLKDHEYKKGTWDYQVIFHELSHCLRSGVFEKWSNRKKKFIKVQPEGLNFSNVTTAESLNSLFAVSLFDYDENDIAYQLQSNYHKVMIDCMDNYSLSDYIEHSISYYAKKLDEFNQDKNYATTILELIQAQYDDYHDDKINVAQSEYYPIYDYIADMYYKKHLGSNTDLEDAKVVTDELLSQILFDVPEDYNIDTNHFYEHMEEYCNSKTDTNSMTK